MVQFAKVITKDLRCLINSLQVAKKLTYSLIMHQIQFGGWALSRPTGGAYSAPILELHLREQFR